MSAEAFTTLRKKFRLSQSDLADALGVSLRTIQGIESSESGDIPVLYRLAMERLSLASAVLTPDPANATPDIREHARELVAWEVEFAKTSRSARYSLPKRDMIDMVNPGRIDNPKRGLLIDIRNGKIAIDPDGLGAKLPVGHADRR